MERSPSPDPLTHPADPPVLRVHDLSHAFEPPAGTVLRNVDLEVRSGELVVLTGPSGAGKTTLMHFLAGIATPQRGEIQVAGREVHRGRSAALVPQGAWLLPRLTVEDNVALPLLLRGVSAQETRRRAAAELEAVGCAALAGQDAVDLSAGERARIALARGLATAAPVLLVDEPTGNLDAASRDRIVERLDRAAREEGRAVLVTTHDEALIGRADRILSLREGRLEEAEAHTPTPPGKPAPAPAEGASWRRIPHLAHLLTRGFRGRLALAAAGVAVVVALSLGVLGLLRGGETVLTDQVLGDLPARYLRVRPSTLSLGVVELSLDRFAGGLLDRQAVETLEGLPGVREAYPQAMSAFPVTVSASLLGRGFRTDVALEGLPADWLAPEIPAASFQWSPREDGEGEPIPVVLSDALLALYNAGFAKSHGLPRLGRDSVRGLELRTILGDSSFGRAPGPPIRARLQVVGFSSKVSPLTLAVPFDVVDHYNRLFAERATDDPEEVERRTGLTSVVLELADMEAVPRVTEAVRDRGFVIDEGDGLAPRVGRALRSIQAAAGALSIVLVVLFVVLVSQLFAALLAIRRRYLDLLEVLGASRGAILGLLTAEVAGATLAGAVVGSGLAWLLGSGAAAWLQGWARDHLALEVHGLFEPPAVVLLVLVWLVLPLVTVLLSLPGTLAWLRRPLLERLRGA